MKAVACAASRSLNSNFQAANDKKGTIGSTIIFFIFIFYDDTFIHSKTLSQNEKIILKVIVKRLKNN